MRNFGPVIGVLAACMLVGGCASGRGLGRSGPDEFAVARQAPLVIPPDFGLKPPAPGAARPQDTANNTQTLDALFGGPAARSSSEAATINEAGLPDAGIRSSVGDTETNVIDKGSTTRDIEAAPQGDGQDARATAG